MNTSCNSTGKCGICPGVWVGLAVVVVVVLFQFLWPRGDGASLKSSSDRRPYAEFAMSDLDGKTWSLEQHRGKVILINIWATWCGPCRSETPDLVRVANKYRPMGLEMVGISVDKGDVDKVRNFAREYSIPYPVLIPEGPSPVTASVDSIPVTILLDRQGRVAAHHVGMMTEADLSRQVESLLNEKG